MSKTAELINSECNVDFIDINMGCPIDLVFKKVSSLSFYEMANSNSRFMYIEN